MTVATEVMVVTEGVQTAKFCQEDQEDLGRVALRKVVVEEEVWGVLVAVPRTTKRLGESG